jgi:archaellum component FlaD/FlaE
MASAATPEVATTGLDAGAKDSEVEQEPAATDIADQHEADDKQEAEVPEDKEKAVNGNDHGHREANEGDNDDDGDDDEGDKEEKDDDENDEEDPVASDPNFAVVCAFIERFGAACGLQCPNIGDLQDMVECKGGTVKQEWILFQVKLLRKLKKSVSTDKWERALAKFAHGYSQADGWELERFGYKNCKSAVKLRLLKALMEAQFDVNPKFKQEINSKPAADLR